MGNGVIVGGEISWDMRVLFVEVLGFDYFSCVAFESWLVGSSCGVGDS
jgi:hypothetical protein